MKSESSEREMARRIMYHQHRKQRENMRYQIIAAEQCESLAKRIEDVSCNTFYVVCCCNVAYTQKIKGKLQ